MSRKTIQLFLRGIEGKTTTINIEKNASVEDLFDVVMEKTGIDRISMRLLYCSKELQTKEDGTVMYLENYDLKSQCNLQVLLRLIGGSSSDGSEENKRLARGAMLTDLPDMLLVDDDETEKRALMSCGHAIGPNSLFQFCRSLMDAGKYEFFCPSIVPHCGKRWEYTDIKKIVVLSEKEETFFETKISENFLRRAMGMRECPECGSFCERQDKKKICVLCPICTKKNRKAYQFCWHCLKAWSSPNYVQCGNQDCDGKDPRLKILKESSNKEIVGVKGCPNVRACPKCGLLIECKDKCKHIMCRCGQHFCFICLKVAINGKYQCGVWNTPCNVAPIQEEIQGD